MKSTGYTLVLGGTGFIGQEVVRALIAQSGTANIRLLTHSAESSFAGLHTYRGSLEKMDWNLLNDDPPKHIIHLARLNSKRYGKWGRLWAAEKGRKANQRLIRHIKTRGWNSPVTLVSGSLMYGHHGVEPVFEDHPLHPVSFARQYYRAEEPWIQSSLPVIVLRLPWVFGSGSWFEAFYLRHMRDKNVVFCYGDGSNRMSFIEVGDAGRCIAWAASNLRAGTYNLAMPDILTQADFTCLLTEITCANHTVIDNKLLKKQYEQAAFEAFTSSICLHTRYAGTFPPELMEFKNVRQMLETRLPLFLKNE